MKHSTTPRLTSLPVIDLASPDAAQQLYRAGSEVGFQCLVNHGVDAEAVAAVAALEGHLSAATKAQLDAIRKPTPGYGPGLQYSGHMEQESYETEEGVYTAGHREDFVVVHPDAARKKADGVPYYVGPGGRIWYADTANRFWDDASRAVLERYYRALERLSLKVLRLYGEAVAGESEAFVELVADHTTNLVNGYHGSATSAGDDERVSGHSDTGLFTIINYGSSGFSGLEVKGSDGEWRLVDPAAFPAGALLLNTADSMHRLSNGRLRSTPHRVIDRSPKGTPLPHRLAMIYFFAPSYDAVLAPHVREGEAARFEPIVAGTLAHNYLTCPTEQREAFDAWVAERAS